MFICLEEKDHCVKVDDARSFKKFEDVNEYDPYRIKIELASRYHILSFISEKDRDNIFKQLIKLFDVKVLKTKKTRKGKK